MVFILDRPEGDDPQLPLTHHQEVAHPITAVVPAPASLLELAADAQASQLQLGEFTLGDTDCPSLTGHPDIRY